MEVNEPCPPLVNSAQHFTGAQPPKVLHRRRHRQFDHPSAG